MIKKILTNDKKLHFDGANANPSVQGYEGGANKRSGNPRQAAGQPYSIMPRKGTQILSR